MNESILDTPTPAAPAAENSPARPAELPEKFWDADAGNVRVDALAKSYVELERRLGGQGAVPAAPDAYDIPSVENGIGPDPEVNARLHGAGFTNDQARLVYELANEVLPHMAATMAADTQQMLEVDHLRKHFGGPERWNAAKRQIGAWGRANLPGPVFEALACTAEGVIALERMMRSGEPGLMAGGDPAPGLGEDDLKQMMRNPRYWREQDPAIVNRVRDGFRRLYPDKG